MDTAQVSRAGTTWPDGPTPIVGTDGRTRSRLKAPPGIGLAFAILVLLVALFEVLRLLLYVRNRDLAEGASLATIVRSFLVGLRFDTAVAAYVTLPILFLSKLARLIWGTTGERRFFSIAAVSLGVVFLVLGLAELEFYREYSCRFNRLAVQYLTQPATVLSMIWNGFPVIRYLLLAAALAGAYVFGIAKLVRRFFPNDAERPSGRGLLELVGLIAATALLVVAARGGLQRKPLQWGDAVHSKSVFANHLAQNGFWMLAKDLFGGTGHSGDSEELRHLMPTDEARDRTRRLLLVPQEELSGDHDRYPLLRSSPPGYRTVSLQPVSQVPPNVVVIMMESFSARFVGAVGSDNDHTPEFNRLAQRGILFDRCFSNGTRTHQAHYTIMASFPNLPTTEWLMQNTLGDQLFDSLPRAFKQRGYHTIYLHNGHLDWDNVEGFFKFQGVERFIGLRDFDTKQNFVGTWGVLDNVLFERANKEFSKMKGPFYATIMTATNHVPFECPKPLPFPEVIGAGKSNGNVVRFPRNGSNYVDRLNGVRYSDWSLGQFFELARKEAYFRNTLFVVVGDHGINFPPVLTELNLLHHHVPLLFYAPALLGEEPQRIHAVASHLDIAPTILGLLGDTGPHQHWGRDLVSLPDGDEGFAVIKSTAQPELGLVRGDTVLVNLRKDKSRLYRYDLGFPPSVVELGSSESVVAEEMDRDLRAYIQTATEVLTTRHAAP